MTKILLAEDDVLFSHIIANRLRKEGYEVNLAYDGEEAIEHAKADKPDLLILDILMPKKDGFEVLAALREAKETASLTVLILSNISDGPSIEKAQKMDVNNFMVKSSSPPQVVIEKVNALLGKHT